MKLWQRLWLLLPAVTVTGCSAVGSYQSHDTSGAVLLSANAKQAIAYTGVLRNPVIVIHGLLGARLIDRKTGEEIWGTFDSRPAASEKEIQCLALPMAKGKRLSELVNDTAPEALLDTVDIRLLGVPITMQGYGALIKILESYGYVSEAKRGSASYSTLFVFYYDWRRDLAENAARLDAFVDERRAMLQKAYEHAYGVKDYDVRFDLVTHSMGGLLARYYLRYGGADFMSATGDINVPSCVGAKKVDRLVQIGTPNGGYLDTLLEMHSGLQLVKGTKTYPGALLGTFPSYYQMLPHPGLGSVLAASGEELDIYDPQNWIDLKWGLADPAADSVLKLILPEVADPDERSAIALDHLSKCLNRAKQLSAAMSSNDPEALAEVTQILFLGDSVTTHSKAQVVNVFGKRANLKIIAADSGDGKVLEVSAIFDLKRGNDHPLPFVLSPIKWSRVVHLRGAHMGIIDSQDFGRNLGFCLLQMPTKSQMDRALAIFAEKQ